MQISMLAIDLAKGSFRVCGVGPDGSVLFNRAMSRPRFPTYLAEQPACFVADGSERDVAPLGPGRPVARP